MKQPLVSVIVTTLNNTATLDACLASIAAQSYPHIELLVVDNNSTDDTVQIAHKYTRQVFSKGPERSAQRNFGVREARGAYVVIIDSDMVLDGDVIADCAQQVVADTRLKALVIPEESFGQGFWARCKQLERSFYVGVSWMEAARFFNRETYLRAGGYNEELVSGEDWDLSQRVAKLAPIGRVQSYIRHNEGRLRLGRTLQKKYYYAQKFARYIAENKRSQAVQSQTGIVSRYALFFSRPSRLFKHPLVSLGMLYMKTAEFAWGGLGYVTVKLKGAR